MRDVDLTLVETVFNISKRAEKRPQIITACETTSGDVLE
jgi:hypothetical protein